MKQIYSPIKQHKASDLIVQELWSAILNGNLQPGDKLPPERELVKNFQVSKVTLREALQKLEAYDLIERKRGAMGGAFVQKMSPTKGFELLTDFLNMRGFSFEDVIKAKLFIEPLIAYEVAMNITDEGIDELQLLIEKHESEYKAKGSSKFGRHLEPLLAKFSGNKVLQIISEFLAYLVKEFEDKLDKTDPKIEKVLKEYHKNTFEDHRLIIDAIITRNPEEAQRLMHQHRLNWAGLIEKLWEKN